LALFILLRITNPYIPTFELQIRMLERLLETIKGLFMTLGQSPMSQNVLKSPNKKPAECHLQCRLGTRNNLPKSRRDVIFITAGEA
jgi:hypothetical protein